jgi:hypothetical protein
LLKIALPVKQSRGVQQKGGFQQMLKGGYSLKSIQPQAFREPEKLGSITGSIVTILTTKYATSIG